jgi:hypothetical protein
MLSQSVLTRETISLLKELPYSTSHVSINIGLLTELKNHYIQFFSVGTVNLVVYSRSRLHIRDLRE